MPSNTTQNPQLVIGQQIDALQSQLTGLMTKVNNHINAHFQQLEEKLTTQSVLAKSATIPNQSSPITETMANHVIDEYRHRENVIIHNVPKSTVAESSVRISHDTKTVSDIAKSIDAGLLKM